MASSGDMFQVTLQGTWLNATWLNTFYYRLMDTPSEGHMTGLLTEFDNQMVTQYKNSLPSEAKFDLITAKNLFTGDEATRVPSVRAGTRATTSDPLPSFVAAHCKLVRSNNRVRHGHKYLIGLCEQDVSGNFWNSAALTFLAFVAGTYKATLAAGAGVDQFAPVIIGRVQYNPEPGRVAYRLPVSAAEMGDQWAYIVDAAFSAGVTTMRSRKFDHGQ